MPKISRTQAESFREIAAASVNSFIELGATRNEEPKLKKQIKTLLDAGMTNADLDLATRALAKDKDEKYLRSLKQVRQIFGL